MSETRKLVAILVADFAALMLIVFGLCSNCQTSFDQGV